MTSSDATFNEGIQNQSSSTVKIDNSSVSASYTIDNDGTMYIGNTKLEGQTYNF